MLHRMTSSPRVYDRWQHRPPAAVAAGADVVWDEWVPVEAALLRQARHLQALQQEVARLNLELVLVLVACRPVGVLCDGRQPWWARRTIGTRQDVESDQDVLVHEVGCAYILDMSIVTLRLVIWHTCPECVCVWSPDGAVCLGTLGNLDISGLDGWPLGR